MRLGVRDDHRADYQVVYCGRRDRRRGGRRGRVLRARLCAGAGARRDGLNRTVAGLSSRLMMVLCEGGGLISVTVGSAVLSELGLCCRPYEYLVEGHAPGAGDGERDDLGDVVGGDG